MHNGIFFFCFVLSSTAACQPATTFNHGVNVAYLPSVAAAGQPQVTGAAIALAAQDQAPLASAGAAYLGEMEIDAERTTTSAFGNATGAKNLEGRASLESAMRGATHFTLLSSSIESKFHDGRSEAGQAAAIIGKGDTAERIQVLKVRYGLYRVEEPRWAQLPEYLRPLPQARP